MIYKKAAYAILNPSNGKCLHTGASGYFFFLTFSVLYVCDFCVYPLLYKDDNDRFNSMLFLHFVFFNIMGNYFLGVKVNSFFKKDSIFPDLPQSWRFCSKCNQHSPPRSHHCSVCNACVLKRDHHCFFLCQCVGQNNQKYFIMFAFYVAIGSFHALKVILLYLDLIYVPLQWTLSSAFSYFLPMVFFNWLFTDINVTWSTFFCVLVLYCCFSTAFGCLFLFLAECFLVYRDQTPYEFQKNFTLKSGGAWHNFKQVFGSFWFVHFFFPLPVTSKESFLKLSNFSKAV